MLLLLLFTACETEPTRFEDCAALSEVVPREDCRLAFAKQALDEPEALKALVASVEDPASRDLLINRLAKTDPRRAGALCAMTSTPAGGAKCQSTVGRPHLTATRPGEGDAAPAPGEGPPPEGKAGPPPKGKAEPPPQVGPPPAPKDAGGPPAQQ